MVLMDRRAGPALQDLVPQVRPVRRAQQVRRVQLVRQVWVILALQARQVPREKLARQEQLAYMGMRLQPSP